MTNDKFNAYLKGQGFQPMNQGDEPGKQSRYFKTYNAIGVVVVFDSITGELVAYELKTEDAVYLFVSGDLVIKNANDHLPTTYLVPTVTLQGANLCSLINVYRIVTFKQLEDAIDAFEKSIEVRVLNELLPYSIGERIVYDNGETSQIAQIEDIEVTESTTKYILRLWNGRRASTFLEGNFSKTLQTRNRFDVFHNLQTVAV